MSNRKASIKETGEELSQEDWARFDAAVASVQRDRSIAERRQACAPDVETSGTGPSEDAPRR
jgi:hypothetical protein